jgi:hypothetical protein
MNNAGLQTLTRRENAVTTLSGFALARLQRLSLRAALTLGVYCLVFLAVSAPAQYAINWSTIDGGGGTSTGGVYSVSGTIGQPDAGPTMTNGQFSVTGGFWALPTAVQTPDAPVLTIAPATPGNATISWSPNTPGFVLQETWNLSPANWTNSLSGATNPIVVPASVPAKFYRLFKP